MHEDALPTYLDLLARTDAPPGSAWGVFGENDQRGTLNLLELSSLAAASTEVRSGQAYSLDLRSDAISPSLAPTRSPLQHHIFQRTPHHRDEWLDNVYTQYGSQVDGLRHIAHPDHGFYNGADPESFEPGTDELSIHHLSRVPIAGRAVLLDVDRHLRTVGRPIHHDASHAITAADLDDTARAQGSVVRPGDIVLIRTGWLDWYRTTATPLQQARLSEELLHPGLAQSHDTVEWLWDHRVSMVAADNFALESWPAADSSPFFSTAEQAGEGSDPHAGIMHRALIALLGMPIGELWDLEELAAASHEDARYSCLLTAAVMPLVGGVGSPANAIAMR